MKKEISKFALGLISYCYENHSDQNPMVWTVDNYATLSQDCDLLDEAELSGMEDKELDKFFAALDRVMAKDSHITLRTIIKRLYDFELTLKTGEIRHIWEKATGRPRTKEALDRVLANSSYIWNALELGKEYKWQLGFKTYVWTDEAKNNKKVVTIHKGIPSDLASRSEDWKKEHMMTNWVDIKDVEAGQPMRRKEYLMGYRIVLRCASTKSVAKFLFKNPNFENQAESEAKNAKQATKKNAKSSK